MLSPFLHPKRGKGESIWVEQANLELEFRLEAKRGSGDVSPDGVRGEALCQVYAVGVAADEMGKGELTGI